MRRAHKDRGWDVGVLQEGVLPHKQGRPMQRRLIGKLGRLEDVVQGAHEGQPQAPPARSPAPVQGGPADVPQSMGSHFSLQEHHAGSSMVLGTMMQEARGKDWRASLHMAHTAAVLKHSR